MMKAQKYLVFIIGTIISISAMAQEEKKFLTEIKKDPFEIDITKTKKRIKEAKKKEEEKLQLELSAVIISGNKKLAILHIGGQKYILSEGDILYELSKRIEVKKIEQNYIQITVGSKEIKISF